MVRRRFQMTSIGRLYCTAHALHDIHALASPVQPWTALSMPCTALEIYEHVLILISPDQL